LKNVDVPLNPDPNLRKNQKLNPNPKNPIQSLENEPDPKKNQQFNPNPKTRSEPLKNVDEPLNTDPILRKTKPVS